MFEKKRLRLAKKGGDSMIPPMILAGFIVLVIFWSGFEVNFYIDADGSRSFKVTFGSRSKQRMA